VPKKGPWDLQGIGVQPDTDEAVVLSLDGPKLLVEEHCVPIT
jgi:hypothetical protein